MKSLNKFVLVLAVVAGLAVTGCDTTVTPKHVYSQQISYDGNQQNGGLLGRTSAGDWIITGHAHDRYMALVETYANSPATKGWELRSGMTAHADGSWVFDTQHMFYFATMERWHKEGK